MLPSLSAAELISHLPRRPADSHKGMFGTVAVIGGARGMVGAPLLAARAALKLGAGCVRVGMIAEPVLAVDPTQPELMIDSASEILRQVQFSVLVMGCGMGMQAPVLLGHAMNCSVPLVLDADALNLLAQYGELRALLAKRSAPTVFTPHPGEAANLLGWPVATVQADRVTAVQQLAQQLGGPVVLKGFHSLCADVDGKVFINNSGNPGMSTAGMGDVLAGMVASFLAQNMTPMHALCLAVHLHGAAGDTFARHDAIGMTASELTEQARHLLHQWQKNH